MMNSTRKSWLGWTSLATLSAYAGILLLPFAPVLAQPEAAKGKKVALFVLPAGEGDGGTASLLTRVLRDNMAGMQGVGLIVPAPVPNASLLPDVLARLDQAYAMLNGKQVKEALAALNSLKPDLEAVLPLVPVRSVALFYKAYGVALAATGSMADGKKAVEISLLLFRNQTNLEYAYSVEIIKMFMELQTALDGRATVRVDIETQPAGAVVSLDSREPAQAPTNYATIPVGPHLVKAVLDGFEQYAGFYIAKRGEENKAVVALKPIPEKAVLDERLGNVAAQLKAAPEAAKPALLALKEFLGVDELLVVNGTLLGENFEMMGFHLRGDQVTPIKRALSRDATFLAGVKEFLSGTFESFYELASRTEGLGGPPIDPTVLQKAGLGDQSTQVFDPDNPVFPTVERGPGKETITDKWWFWTGVGILAAGAVGGVVALLTSTSDTKGPTGTIEIQLP